MSRCQQILVLLLEFSDAGPLRGCGSHQSSFPGCWCDSCLGERRVVAENFNVAFAFVTHLTGMELSGNVLCVLWPRRPGWIREYANLRSWHLAIGMVSVLLPRKLGGPRLGSFEILLVVGMEEILSPDDWGLVVAQFKHQVFDVFLGEVLRACCQCVKHRRAFGAPIQIPKVVEGPGAFSQFVFSTTVRTFMLSWLFR